MADAETSGLAGEVEEAAADTDSGEEEPGSELRLMYNSVRSYVSVIMELWKHQVAKKLHSSPPPHNVAVKVLETSVAQASINAAAISWKIGGSPQSRMGIPQGK